MNEHTEQYEGDEISTERLTQSWNGFTSIDTRPSYEFHRNFTRPHTRDQATERVPNQTRTFPRHSEQTKKTKPRFTNYQASESQHKTLKMPKTFPGMKTTGYRVEKGEEKRCKKLVENEHAGTNLTRRRVETRSGGKLARIKVTKAKGEVSTTSKLTIPQGGSHAFNCARMLTELNEVCSLKSEGDAGQNECEGNSLRLKTVREARRYSAFTPRGNTESFSYTRCRSMPNLNSRESPKRFFVKLDPLRASATQVNLDSWNRTSRRCRILSENLYKLDEQGIEPSEKERKVLIGQWIREINQSEYETIHVTTAEVET
jgi:hypothetical protein